MRVAYVRGFRGERDREVAVEKGEYPHQEHSLFIREPGVAYVTYDDVELAYPGLSEVLRDQGLLQWAPAACLIDLLKGVDAIVASGEDVGLPLALQLRCGVLCQPLSIITHGFLVYDEPLLRAIRDLDSVRFLCLAHSIEKLLLYQFGVPRERVMNLGWGVDTDFFRPIQRKPSSPPLIVAAGTAHRDYATLVRATRDIEVRVQIAADSPWYPRDLDIAGDRLPANVTVGSCGDYATLRELYASASIVVVPLHAAPFACGYAVISEAMAMGKPVIATRTASLSDFFVDGETGLYVRPGDFRDLASKLGYLIANPDLARRMGLAGRKRMEGRFSHSHYRDRLQRLVGLPLAQA